MSDSARRDHAMLVETESIGKSSKEEAVVLRSLLQEVRGDRDKASKDNTETIGLLREQNGEFSKKLKTLQKEQAESGGRNETILKQEKEAFEWREERLSQEVDELRKMVD